MTARANVRPFEAGNGVEVMAGKSARSWSANVAAAALVGAAGLVTWYGLGQTGGESVAAPAAATATLAVTDPPEAPIDAAVPRAAAGNLPTRVVVPAAGIDAAVAEVGVSLAGPKPVWETAWRAAGHHIDSARPGQPGNVVITGHVSVADRANLAVFRSLDRVAAGDLVEVSAGDTVFRYRVDRVAVVSPAAVGILRSGHAATLTLITCTRDLAHRLVVTATLI
ncbi:MAG: class F sortase [Dehalococcoidia bacterium]|nr:class F sortase [Dehalococcoidia bacterium]